MDFSDYDELDGGAIDLDDPEFVEDIVRQSAVQSNRSRAAVLRTSVASSSNGRDHTPDTRAQRQLLQGELSKLNRDVATFDQDIKRLQSLRKDKFAEIKNVQAQIDALNARPKGMIATKNYFDEFEWSAEMKARMEEVFGIQSFRLAQEGVCNANMDGRDIVCVMPTGGGKSLTYQLPAVLTPGCTIVISPLIALITDQILHLRENGVQAAMMTSAASRAEQNEIYQRMIFTATGKGTGRQELKLLYVTPEKIAKSNTFINAALKLSEMGKLARIVIDEAHCVSQLGHDFRPDYKKLSSLKVLFPDVPILALSATCPPAVLQDLLKILHLKPITMGTSANPDGTIYFSSPLYRKNLHYKVVEKSSATSGVIRDMVHYIQANHRNQSGIIYCFTRKDSESVALGIQEQSYGSIKTGTYHAEISDDAKELLHERWRKGEVKVVCATIAFGLGIDKADVRFVLHHSMSKSVENYYQESGRAGRDGDDADCVLYYRSQDAFRFADIIHDVHGAKKIHDMIQFCIDPRECRKVLFARYFSASSNLSLSAWTSSGTDSLEPCGHCDNCTRDPATIDDRDVTLDAWRLLKIAQTGHKFTANQLADCVRGSGALAKKMNLLTFIDGKTTLSVKDVDTLIMCLLLDGYLKENYQPNAYQTIVYLQPSTMAHRILQQSKVQIDAGTGFRVTYPFLKPAGKGKGRPSASTGTRTATTATKRAAKQSVMEGDGAGAGAQAQARPRKRQRKSAPDAGRSEETRLNLQASSSSAPVPARKSKDKGKRLAARPSSSSSSDAEDTPSEVPRTPPHTRAKPTRRPSTHDAENSDSDSNSNSNQDRNRTSDDVVDFSPITKKPRYLSGTTLVSKESSDEDEGDGEWEAVVQPASSKRGSGARKGGGGGGEAGDKRGGNGGGRGRPGKEASSSNARKVSLPPTKVIELSSSDNDRD